MNENMTHHLSFFDKLKKGFFVALKSLKFIWHNKKLLFFPLLTGALIVGSIGIYDGIYYALYHKHVPSFFPKKEHRNEDSRTEQSKKNKYPVEYVLFILIVTFISIFSFAFSNVALSYAASQAFQNYPINIGVSIMHSIKKLPTLLMWTISAFVIHILLNIAKGKSENGRSSFLGRLIGEAAEFAWYIATFLVIPVMAHENVGAFKSIKRSTQLMKKTFGENLAATLLLPQLIGFIILLWLLLSIGILYATLYIGKSSEINLFFSVGLPLVGLLFIVAGILCCAVSAATTVFKTAAYYYALGVPVGPFKDEEIRSSFVTEIKK